MLTVYILIFFLHFTHLQLLRLTSARVELCANKRDFAPTLAQRVTGLMQLQNIHAFILGIQRERDRERGRARAHARASERKRKGETERTREREGAKERVREMLPASLAKFVGRENIVLHFTFSCISRSSSNYIYVSG